MTEPQHPTPAARCREIADDEWFAPVTREIAAILAEHLAQHGESEAAKPSKPARWKCPDCAAPINSKAEWDVHECDPPDTRPMQPDDATKLAMQREVMGLPAASPSRDTGPAAVADRVCSRCGSPNSREVDCCRACGHEFTVADRRRPEPAAEASDLQRDPDEAVEIRLREFGRKHNLAYCSVREFIAPVLADLRRQLADTSAALVRMTDQCKLAESQREAYRQEVEGVKAQLAEAQLAAPAPAAGVDVERLALQISQACGLQFTYDARIRDIVSPAIAAIVAERDNTQLRQSQPTPEWVRERATKAARSWYSDTDNSRVNTPLLAEHLVHFFSPADEQQKENA